MRPDVSLKYNSEGENIWVNELFPMYKTCPEEVSSSWPNPRAEIESSLCIKLHWDIEQINLLKLYQDW